MSPLAKEGRMKNDIIHSQCIRVPLLTLIYHPFKTNLLLSSHALQNSSFFSFGLGQHLFVYGSLLLGEP